MDAEFEESNPTTFRITKPNKNTIPFFLPISPWEDDRFYNTIKK